MSLLVFWESRLGLRVNFMPVGVDFGITNSILGLCDPILGSGVVTCISNFAYFGVWHLGKDLKYFGQISSLTFIFRLIFCGCV